MQNISRSSLNYDQNIWHGVCLAKNGIGAACQARVILAVTAW